MFFKLYFSVGRKDELIAELIRCDGDTRKPIVPDASSHIASSIEPTLTSDELKELATISDEMRHLRRQWILQQPRPAHGSIVRKA